MYIILLILFFTSLILIIFMIARKLPLLQNGQIKEEEILFEIPYIKEIRYVAVKNIKKYGHESVVTTLRLYVRGTKLFKRKYEEIKIKIKDVTTKSYVNNTSPEKIEVSKFLKKISDYKHKIREIKHRIHEEENNS